MRPVEVFQQRKEIEVLKMCQHPNIVRLVDLFETVDSYYLVLEHMAGKDLFDYLRTRNFKLSEERTKQIIGQIALALQYLHSLGIIHRDIKLENIMMTEGNERGIPKLVDFGLAKFLGPSIKTTEPFGTLGYVAPEVLKKEPYSYSCDVWSLGCIAYALLCGSLPFDNANQNETIRLTVHAQLLFDLPCWQQVSEQGKHFISLLLTKDPNQRITIENALTHPWLAKAVARKL